MTASGEAPQALETPETKPDFLEVYARWVSPIYRYFRSHVGEDPLAEDLTSQLFLKAYQAWPRFEPKRSLAAWLFRIAHNLAMDHYRAARRSRNYLEQAAQNQAFTTDPAPDTDALLLLRTAMDGLNHQDQELLRLRYLNQLSFAELGQVLGFSEQAAKKKTYRLLQALRQRMGGKDD